MAMTLWSQVRQIGSQISKTNIVGVYPITTKIISHGSTWSIKALNRKFALKKKTRSGVRSRCQTAPSEFAFPRGIVERRSLTACPPDLPSNRCRRTPGWCRIVPPTSVSMWSSCRSRNRSTLLSSTLFAHEGRCCVANVWATFATSLRYSVASRTEIWGVAVRCAGLPHGSGVSAGLARAPRRCLSHAILSLCIGPCG